MLPLGSPPRRRLGHRLRGCSLALALACLPLILTSCATNPVTGGKDVVTMSEAQEIELGRRMHPQVLQKYGRYDDEALQSYVNDVGQRIARNSHRPNLQYTFTVLDGDEVNAFALPGGYVYITRGIMAYINSEAELTAVLGHEVGHITARHQVRQATGQTATGIGAAVVGILTGSGDLANVVGMAGSALTSGYGRDMELEADAIGAEYLDRLGFEPSAMIDVVRLLKNQEMHEVLAARQEHRQPHVYHGVFASHPDNDTRLTEVVAAASKIQSTGQRPNRSSEYLQRIDGLPIGPSRAQGVVRGNRFYHGDLGITLAFPTGWVIDNQQDKVVAVTPQKDAALIVNAEQIPPGMTPAQMVQRLGGGSLLDQSEPLTVNGLPAHTAVVQSARLPWGNQGPMRLAVVYYNNLAYVFRGATRTGSALPASDPFFMSSVRTFRRLKDSEFSRAEPDRLRVIRATDGMTIAELAKRSPLREYPAEQLRLLNDLYPNREPTPGRPLKIVQ
jgi:predicted Zn-dependent protease